MHSQSLYRKLHNFAGVLRNVLKPELHKQEYVYLIENPDVQIAVENNVFKNGREHYLRHGKLEGRIWPKNSDFNPQTFKFPNRNALSTQILKDTAGKILEIGPLSMPLVKGPSCSYFDLMPTDELKEKARIAGLNPDDVPNIDFWNPEGDLSEIRERFDSVVSSHCIEHQPDLIQHLKSVANLLNPNGTYYLVIPDHRYCFDHFLPPSGMPDVIIAHQERRRMPNRVSIIKHLVFTTHNDAVRHWKGDHSSGDENISERWNTAEEFIKRNEGLYSDVHCWQFEPNSFSDLIDNLFELGYIDFKCIEIFPTVRNKLEFFAILQKSKRVS
jgi:SAM-dependent methyltransferase